MLLMRRVVGNSMLPTLRDGQVVWAYRTRNFQEGQVIIAFVNGQEVIKRIARIERDRLFLMGDNPHESTDSRQYGSVSDVHAEGVIFWPSTRIGQFPVDKETE